MSNEGDLRNTKVEDACLVASLKVDFRQKLLYVSKPVREVVETNQGNGNTNTGFENAGNDVEKEGFNFVKDDLVANAIFIVDKKYRIIGNTRFNAEVKIKILSQEYIKEICLPMSQITKMLRDIENLTEGNVCINSTVGMARTKIEAFIKYQMPQSETLKMYARTGFAEYENLYVFGDVIIGRDVDIAKNCLPHVSIKDFSLQRGNIEALSAIKFIEENLIGISESNEFLGTEFMLIRLLAIKISKLRKNKEFPRFVKVIVGCSQVLKTESAKTVLPICGSRKGKIDLTMNSTIAAIENSLAEFVDMPVLIDDKADVEDRTLERHYDKLFNGIPRLYGDGENKKKCGREIKEINNMAVITAENLPAKISVSTISRLDVTKVEQGDIKEDKLEALRSNPENDSEFIFYYIKFLINKETEYYEKFYVEFKKVRGELDKITKNSKKRLVNNRAWLIVQNDEYLDFLVEHKIIEMDEKVRRSAKYKKHCLDEIDLMMERIEKEEELSKFFITLYKEIAKGKFRFYEAKKEDKAFLSQKYAHQTNGKQTNKICFIDDFLGFSANGFYFIEAKIALKAVEQSDYNKKSNVCLNKKVLLDLLDAKKMLIKESAAQRDSELYANSSKNSRLHRFTVNGITHRYIKMEASDFNKLADVYADDE